MDKKKSLISFVGAPWTLAVYMFGLKIDKNKIDLSKLTKIGSQIDFFLEKIVEFLCVHIINQVNPGADVVQIFDSWAGLIPEKNLVKYCYEPNRQIIDFCKTNNIQLLYIQRTQCG